MHRLVGVVAVAGVLDGDVAGGGTAGGGGELGVTPAVIVGVPVPGRGVHGVGLVHHAVAVVVVAVTVFAGAWVGCRVAVVAVAGVVHLARGGLTAHHGAGRVAVAVAVDVDVEGLGVAGGLVHGPIAVIVRAVAALGCARVHAAQAVVAVIGAGHEARWGGAAEAAGGGVAVAVAVRVGVPGRAVPGAGVGVVAVVSAGRVAFGRSAGDDGAGGVAVAVSVGVQVPQRALTGLLVHLPVAVLIHTVAGLHRTGMYRFSGVVTVLTHIGAGPAHRGRAGPGGGAGHTEAVAVGILVPAPCVEGVRLVPVAVAVIVDAVAQLDRSG